MSESERLSHGKNSFPSEPHIVVEKSHRRMSIKF